MHANLGGALFSALSSSSHRRPSVSSVLSRSRDSSDVFYPSFFSPQSARYPSKASLAAQHARHRQLTRVIVFRYAACYKSPVEPSRATNCSSRQALFVPGNHCPAIFCWSARHAFLPKKIEKVQYLQKHTVLSVVCGVWWIFSVREEFGRL